MAPTMGLANGRRKQDLGSQADPYPAGRVDVCHAAPDLR